MSRATSTSRALSVYNPRRAVKVVTVGGGPSSGGKLTTRKIGKAKSKYSKNRRAGSANGVVHCQETTGIQTDANCVYLGHALPIYQLKFAAWWAVFRKIHLMAGGTVGEFLPGNLISTVGVSVGDNYGLTYRLNSGLAPATFNYAINAGDVIEDVINQFSDGGTIDAATVEFLHFVYTPIATSPLKRSQLKLDLLSMKISWKSSLKLQNRTLGTTSDTGTDEPDNCPIYGKSYSGPGLGLKLAGNVSQTISGLAANAGTGTIRSSAGANRSLQEPPEPNQFQKVTKAGKIHLAPGEVKTSVLTKVINVRFGYLMNIIAPAPPPAGPEFAGLKINGRFSVYRVFAMEKMMDVNSGTATNVSIAYENDSKIFVSCSQKYANPTLQYKEPTFRPT